MAYDHYNPQANLRMFSYKLKPNFLLYEYKNVDGNIEINKLFSTKSICGETDIYKTKFHDFDDDRTLLERKYFSNNPLKLTSRMKFIASNDYYFPTIRDRRFLCKCAAVIKAGLPHTMKKFDFFHKLKIDADSNLEFKQSIDNIDKFFPKNELGKWSAYSSIHGLNELFMKMDMILVTCSDDGFFITSDNPIPSSEFIWFPLSWKKGMILLYDPLIANETFSPFVGEKVWRKPIVKIIKLNSLEVQKLNRFTIRGRYNSIYSPEKNDVIYNDFGAIIPEDKDMPDFSCFANDVYKKYKRKNCL